MTSVALRVARRAACVVCATLGVPALLLGALTLLSLTPWGRGLLSRKVEQALATTGANVTFRAQLEWPLDLVLNDVRASWADGNHLEAPRVVIRPRIAALLRGRLEAWSMSVDRPVLRFTEKKTNTQSQSQTQGDAWKQVHDLIGRHWPVGTLTIRDGHLYFVRGEAQTSIDGIEVEAHAGPTGGSVRLRAARGVIEDTAELCAFEVSGNVSADGIVVDRLVAKGVLREGSDTVACNLPETDARSIELDVDGGSIRIDAQNRPWTAFRRASARAPLSLLERTGRVSRLGGWAHATLEGRLDPGERLPEAHGAADVHDIVAGERPVARSIEANVTLRPELVDISSAAVDTPAGPLKISDVEIEPFAPGIPAKARVEGTGLRFADFLRALKVARHPHLALAVRTLHWQVAGTLDPLALSGDLDATTGELGIFDGACEVERCERIWGFSRSTIHARAALTSHAFEMADLEATVSGGTAQASTVIIGFHNELLVEGHATLDLAVDSPLASLALAGVLQADVHVFGGLDDPRIAFGATIDGFVLQDHPLGNVVTTNASYSRDTLRFEQVHAMKGASEYDVPSVRIAFGKRGRLDVDVLVDARKLGVRDFLSLARLDERPYFDTMEGSLTHARGLVRFVHGGREDPQGHGTIFVNAQANLVRPGAIGQEFDEGAVRVDVRWWDREAGLAGVDIDLKALELRDRKSVPGAPRPGSLVASGSIVHGKVSGAVAVSSWRLSGITPLERALGPLEGRMSGIAHVAGTTEAMTATADLDVTRVRVGGALYGPSTLHLGALVGERVPMAVSAQGDLLGGEVRIGGVVANAQVVRGRASLRGLRLDPFWTAAAGGPPKRDGPAEVEVSLSGELMVEALFPRDMARSHAAFAPSALEVRAGTKTASLRTTKAGVTLSDDRILIPEMSFDLGVGTKHIARAAVQGSIASVSHAPQVGLALAVPRVDLSLLAGVVPTLDRAEGTLSLNLSAEGPFDAPVFTGEARARARTLALRWIPGELSDVDVDLVADGHEVLVRRAVASLGHGEVHASGACPLGGLSPGVSDVALHTRRVHLPLGTGVETTFDADLRVLADMLPFVRGKPHAVRVGGNAEVDALTYRRRLGSSIDVSTLAALAARQPRHETEPEYDPAGDLVDYSVRLIARNPITVDDDLATVRFLPDGEFWLRGTNQRPSLAGRLLSLDGGKLRLYGTNFDLVRATVVFDDTASLSPQVILVAKTEYRRLTQFHSPMSFASTSLPGLGAQAWRIRLNVSASPNETHVAFSSEPPLSQDDIVFLLALGVTRPELDDLQATQSLQTSAGLEALADLSGAGKIVRNIVQIDDFRFGTEYSPAALRMVPSLMIGKRIDERIAATVAADLAYDDGVRGTLSYWMGQNMWLEALWEDVAPYPATPLGDFGVDLRWGRSLP